MTPCLTDTALAALPGVEHGFFTREGGVSTGIYASLNCGVGSKDDRTSVAENRARVAAGVGASPEQLASPFQVHGTTVAMVDVAWPAGERPRADALVTDKSGIALAIGTADCGPILLADTEARVIGAAHAGWRGALTGVAESVVAAMETRGARRHRIVAALGPTISGANYEVGPELVATFLADDPANERFFRPSGRNGHSLFDLPGYIVARLTAAGVRATSLGLCTYADPERFFSYRRTTHRGEPDYGRHLSAITLRA
jgi:YfiH family protein